MQKHLKCNGNAYLLSTSTKYISLENKIKLNLTKYMTVFTKNPLLLLKVKSLNLLQQHLENPPIGYRVKMAV